MERKREEDEVQEASNWLVKRRSSYFLWVLFFLHLFFMPSSSSLLSLHVGTKKGIEGEEVNYVIMCVWANLIVSISEDITLSITCLVIHCFLLSEEVLVWKKERCVVFLFHFIQTLDSLLDRYFMGSKDEERRGVNLMKGFNDSLSIFFPSISKRKKKKENENRVCQVFLFTHILEEEGMSL